MTHFTDANLYNEYKRIIKEYNTSSGPGQIQLFDWNIEFTDIAAILGFIDYILFRKMNDFYADNDRPVILDCGANIGYTVLNYKRLYPEAKIIAFEPDPDLIPILRRNLERNQAKDVEIVESAVWVEDGTVSWWTGSTDGNHIIQPTSQEKSFTSVPAVDLTKYLSRDVDLLKIDIEGAEFKVIPHIQGHLSRVKNILVEVHITDQSKYMESTEIIRALANSGFQIALNSYGPWRDLVRRHIPDSQHSEQYFLLAGWRSEHPSVLREVSFVPYNSIIDHEEPLALQKIENNLLADSLISIATWNRHWKIQRLQKRFIKVGEFSWVYVFPPRKIRGDEPENPEASTLLLFEEKRLLGPAHAVHQEIRDLGGGRYSHWKDNLYFSTSDGTDPNTNGRTYTIIWRKDSPENA